MADSTNNFKIFDSESENLLSYSEYNSHLQRVRGFAGDEEIPSALCNSVLRQNSLLSRSLITYMTSYVSDVTVQHDMSEEDLNSFITNFFQNWFNNKLANSTISYSKLRITGRTGTMIYSGNDGNETLQLIPPTPTSMLSTNTTYIVGYDYDSENDVVPIKRKIGYYEASGISGFTGQFSSLNTGNWKIFTLDLSDIPGALFSLASLEKYEVNLEFLEGALGRYYNNITIPLNRFTPINYYAPTASEISIVGNTLMLMSPQNDISIYIGLSDTTYQSSVATQIGYYLIMLINTTTVLRIKDITLKERIF